MDACGTRHLRQTLHRAFNIFTSHHHQIGHFVDDHDDIWHWFEIKLLGFVDRFTGITIEAGLNGTGDLLTLFWA